MAAVSHDSLIDSEVVHVHHLSAGCFKVVIDNPPFNLLDLKVFAGLQAARAFAEDPGNAVRVLVFESANPDFFVAHMDLTVDMPSLNESETKGDLDDGPNIGRDWPGLSHWLATGQVVTIALLRGRARGVGCTLAATMDMRFASRENMVMCLPEVGFGAFPDGGGLEWAQLQAGRARAMEFVLSSDDFDAETAEMYGLVNRSLPDAKLDEFVYGLARRIASFNPAAIAMVKTYLTRRQPVPLPQELAETSEAAIGLMTSEAAQATIGRIISKAGAMPFSLQVELDLPRLCDPD